MIIRLMAQFEKASADYATANRIVRDPDWFMLKLQEEIGELTQAWNRLSGRGRHGGHGQAELQRQLEDETADVFGQLLLFARRHGIDLEAAIARKWHFDPRGSPADEEEGRTR